MATVKVCTKCGIEKSLDEFYRRAARPSGKASWCKLCHREYSAEKRNTVEFKERIKQYEARPEVKYRRQVTHLIRKFGIDEQTANELLNTWTCMACGIPLVAGHRITNARHIDHEHDTNRIRGVLCVGCNTVLGVWQKREAGLLRYLELDKATQEIS